MFDNFDISLDDDDKFSKKEQENFDKQFFALCCQKSENLKLEKLEDKLQHLKKIGDTNN